jgi:heat shock protein HslJ
MRLIGALMAGVGLCLAACGNELRATAPRGEPSNAVTSSPVGTSYLSIKLTEDGKVKQLVPGTRIRLDFRDGGALAFNAGCNQLGGTISLDGGIVTMNSYGGTEMGCDPASQAQDEWLGELLKHRPTWKLEGDTLTLTRGSTTLVLQDRRIVEPDLPLAGTKWTVDGVVSGEAVEHFSQLPPAYFTIEGGRITGSTGCNKFEGSVTYTDGNLSVGTLTVTARECVGDVGRLEKAVLPVVGGQSSYSIDYNRLELRSPDGTRGLNLIAKR